MEKLSKDQGLKGQKGSRGPRHDISFIRFIAREYRMGDQSLRQLSQKYNVAIENISRWAKQYSYELAGDTNIIPMTEQEQKDMEVLHKQIEVLKQKLEYEQMRTFALETMIDLAKTELGVDVTKNSGAKQPKE
jgi:transposase